MNAQTHPMRLNLQQPTHSRPIYTRVMHWFQAQVQTDRQRSKRRTEEREWIHVDASWSRHVELVASDCWSWMAQRCSVATRITTLECAVVALVVCRLERCEFALERADASRTRDRIGALRHRVSSEAMVQGPKRIDRVYPNYNFGCLGTQTKAIHLAALLTRKTDSSTTTKMLRMRTSVTRWRRVPRATSSAAFASYSSSVSTATTASTEDKQPRPSRANAHDLTHLVDAMRHFHKQHQHIVVPSGFVVPSAADDKSNSAWPAHLHGLPLGRALRLFVDGRNSSKRRSKRQSDATSVNAVASELQALGLPLAARSWRQFRWEQTALSALQTFKATHGHLRVPRTFVVPSDDASWPRPAWGYKLGAHVNQLRAHRATLEPHQLEALETLGFIWNVIDDKWTSLFLPALRHYHTLHGHASVPQRFVVPSGDPAWPLEALAGFPLGRMVNHIRSGDVYYPQVERFLPELNALGFSFSSIERTWDAKVLPALQVFHRVFGHCNVKKYFIVPDESPWPEAARGMKLGFIVHNIRARGDFFQLVGRDLEQLEALGFVWNVSESKWRLRIFPALKAFVHVHGHATVPRAFVVPASAPWPERAAGLDLGRVVHDVSYRRRYADYIEIERSQLEALGFFWSAADDDSDGSDSDEESSDEEDKEDRE